MSVYSDIKHANDEKEREFLECVARREARRDEYLEDRRCEDIDREADDE